MTASHTPAPRTHPPQGPPPNALKLVPLVLGEGSPGSDLDDPAVWAWLRAVQDALDAPGRERLAELAQAHREATATTQAARRARMAAQDATDGYTPGTDPRCPASLGQHLEAERVARANVVAAERRSLLTHMRLSAFISSAIAAATRGA